MGEFFTDYSIEHEEAYLLSGIKELNPVLQYFKNQTNEINLNIIKRGCDSLINQLESVDVLQFTFEFDGIHQTIEAPIVVEDMKKMAKFDQLWVKKMESKMFLLKTALSTLESLEIYRKDSLLMKFSENDIECKLDLDTISGTSIIRTSNLQEYNLCSFRQVLGKRDTIC